MQSETFTLTYTRTLPYPKVLPEGTYVHEENGKYFLSRCVGKECTGFLIREICRCYEPMTKRSYSEGKITWQLKAYFLEPEKVYADLKNYESARQNSRTPPHTPQWFGVARQMENFSA